MSGTVHIIGAGLAGLSAALSLVGSGRRIVLHESAPHAGGRCRTYLDQRLGCRVDNGNHLLLSGNRDAAWFIDRVGSRDTLAVLPPAFAFIDLANHHRWTVRPNAGRLPWWVFSPARRVPGTRARDYLALVRLLRAAPDATVRDVLDDGGPLYRHLLEPLAVSGLNTQAASASARLLAAIVRETLAAGAAACRPVLPRHGWSDSLIDPALATLAQAGMEVRATTRIVALATQADRLTTIETAAGPLTLAAEDAVILAVPPQAAADLLPGLTVPGESEAIVNIHFALPGNRPPAFTGCVNGLCEWIFEKPGHASVTISAANRLADHLPEDLARAAWAETSTVLGLPHEPAPVWRVVRERRATFAATPAQDRLRPCTKTPINNLVLAGDWTATGLPATIEGAIRSGRTAADSLLSAAQSG